MNDFKNLLMKDCDEHTRQQLKKAILEKYFFVSADTIGKSILEREIECFRIGNSDKEILFCGGVHGSEWITSQLLYLFIIRIADTIINCKSQLTEILLSCFQKYSLIFIPCVNPDGVEISLHGSQSAKHLENFVRRVAKGDTVHWKSNALGVDINHNFNADWQNIKKKEMDSGITFPSMTRYGGEFPESEPETRTLTEYCRTHHILSAIAFHAQGEEIYWSFGEKTPVRSLEIAQKMAELSGYALSFPESIADGGGFKDWLIVEKGIPAFTVEVGKGENPLDIAQLPEIYARLEKMLFYFLSVG